MTKLGPLTSQALGRSPYDIVVPGEGEADPHAPPQEYDDRGRPVNMETKRINRDIVRSHNEVMQVIGVAEPDSHIQAAEEEAARRQRQKRYEDEVAQQLIHVGRILGIVGVWGVNAVRQRILLYREYSTVPFGSLLRHEASRQPIWRAAETGLPVFFTSHSLRRTSYIVKSIRHSFWKNKALQFVRLHLQMFLFLQRTGIVPSEPVLPSPLYFVPFSRESPIPCPPPLPSKLTVHSLAQWGLSTALGFAPIAVFFSYTKMWTWVTEYLYDKIYRWLPTPTNTRPNRYYAPEYLPTSTHSRHNGSATEAASATLSSATPVPNGQSPPPETPTQPQQPQQSSLPLQPLPPPPPDSPTTGRRRNTVSSRGAGDDAYASEEEEFELSTTLISIDVEASDANDNAPSVWQAEVRHGNFDDFRAGGDHGEAGGGGNSSGNNNRDSGDGDENGGGGERDRPPAPIYADSLLVQLPAIIATDIMTLLTSSALMAPYEAFMIRLVARAYRQQHGQPVDDLYGLAVLSPSSGGGGSLNWTSLTNCVGIWLVHLVVDASSWLLVTGLAALYRGADPGWSFFRLLKEKLGYGEKEEEESKSS